MDVQASWTRQLRARPQGDGCELYGIAPAGAVVVNVDRSGLRKRQQNDRDCLAILRLSSLKQQELFVLAGIVVGSDVEREIQAFRLQPRADPGQFAGSRIPGWPGFAPAD